jgi:hypothetical protein
MVTLVIGVGISVLIGLPAFVVYCACIAAARLDRVMEAAQASPDN